MATSINDIIKQLEEISEGTGGGRKESDRREAAKLSKKALADSKAIGNANTKELKQKIEIYRQAQLNFKSGTEEYVLLGKRIKSSEDLIKANTNYIETIRKVGNSFVGLTKAAFEGEGSISAFTDNVKGLGLIGRRLDTNLETFRQLSRTGASFGQSLVTMREAAHEAALPLDDFTKLIGENATSMAAMFGSTTEGAKRIAELGRITREVGIDRLAPLGFTVDEINETLLLNLDSQRRTGILDSLTRSQQRDSAINFAEQLDRLAKLTGQQRDELRKQIEQQQSNERFQIALQNATDETRQRLQGFAATVGNIAPGLNEGFQDLIANAGRPVTESALALVQNIPEAQSIIQRLISGTISSEQALGEIRNASVKSMNRFGAATVTGTVEFLRLQGDVINLGRRIVDVNGVFQEQEQSVGSLVSNLTTFEQATKVLSSQFQGIETGLLKAFGPALGGIIGSIQGLFAKGGLLATALAKAPSLTAGLIVGGLTGKFLFNKAVQIGIIAAGTRLGTAHMPGGGSATMLAKGGAGFAGKGIGAAAGLGMGVGGVLQAGSAETTGGKAMGIGTAALGGGMTGAMIGSMIAPGIGTAIGGAIGAALGGGSAIFAATRQVGTMGATGQRFEPETKLLQVEKGETVLNQQEAKTFANLNFNGVEKQLAAISSNIVAANKIHNSTLDSLNTSNMINNKTRIASETTARKDRNQVGMV
jgi:DNA-binding transcriptional MerR regulator